MLTENEKWYWDNYADLDLLMTGVDIEYYVFDAVTGDPTLRTDITPPDYVTVVVPAVDAAVATAQADYITQVTDYLALIAATPTLASFLNKPSLPREGPCFSESQQFADAFGLVIEVISNLKGTLLTTPIATVSSNLISDINNNSLLIDIMNKSNLALFMGTPPASLLDHVELFLNTSLEYGSPVYLG